MDAAAQGVCRPALAAPGVTGTRGRTQGHRVVVDAVRFGSLTAPCAATRTLCMTHCAVWRHWFVPRPTRACAEAAQDWSRDGLGASPLEARAAAAAGMQGFERQQRNRERRLEARYGGAAAAAGAGAGQGPGASHASGSPNPLSRRVQTRAGAAAGAAGPPEAAPGGGGRGMLLPRIETGQHGPTASQPGRADGLRASDSPGSPQPPIAPAVVDEMEAKLKAAEERRRRHAAGANGDARHRHHNHAHPHAGGGRHGHPAPREGHAGGGAAGSRRHRAPDPPRAPAAAAPPPPVAAPLPQAPSKRLATVEDEEAEAEEWPGASEDVFQRSQFYVAPIPQFGRR